MTLHLLAYAPRGQEFEIAEAVNDLGGMAVAPRRVDIVDGKPLYRPFLPNYIFLAMGDLLWHQIRTRQKGFLLVGKNGRPLAPPWIKDNILPRTWGDFQDFAERSEFACQRRMEQWETGLRVASYELGDILEIAGDLLAGQIKDCFAEFLHLDNQGRIVAKIQGAEMMGKPIIATIDPRRVTKIAAE